MQASKNGFFYVVDAVDGSLVSAKPFIEGVNWARSIDQKTGVPAINPAARYDKTGKGFIVVPSLEGAHSWHPMSYSPQTGLVYIPAVRSTFPLVATHEENAAMGQAVSVDFAKGFALYRRPGAINFSDGLLLAWDPVAQKVVWRVKFDGGRGGGTLATAGGLVFQGNTKNEEFVAYRADTGERLWSAPTRTGIVAGASTYEVAGQQYVAVVAGSRAIGSAADYYAPNYSRLLVFKIGGTAQLPAKLLVAPLQMHPPAAFGSAALIEHGRQVYSRFCSTCHGSEGQSRGTFPDLKYSAAIGSAEALQAIVIDGALSGNGMASFAKAVNAEDVEAVRAYIAGRAIDALRTQPPDPPAKAPH